MKIWMLGSGSQGNALLLESGGTRVLIDAGFRARTLGQRLAAIGIPAASVEAVLVTHEHGDHACGAAVAARRWGWTVLASAGTLRACPELVAAGARSFAPGDMIQVGRLALQTVPVPHDAEAPVAVVATADSSGARVGICYDLGRGTDAIRRAFTDLDLLVLEANHDPRMLRMGPYPPGVQQRIAGPHGHLSNSAAAVIARDCVHSNLRHVILAHLSEHCNEPALAMRTVSSVLADARFRGTLTAATQRGVAGPFEPHAAHRGPPAQLSLGF